jgi:hypothetical protein
MRGFEGMHRACRCVFVARESPPSRGQGRTRRGRKRRLRTRLGSRWATGARSDRGDIPVECPGSGVNESEHRLSTNVRPDYRRKNRSHGDADLPLMARPYSRRHDVHRQGRRTDGQTLKFSDASVQSILTIVMTR